MSLTPWQGREERGAPNKNYASHLFLRWLSPVRHRFSSHQVWEEICCYFTMQCLCVYSGSFYLPAICCWHLSPISSQCQTVKALVRLLEQGEGKHLSFLSSQVHRFCDFLNLIRRLCYYRLNQMSIGVGDGKHRDQRDRGHYRPASGPFSLCWQQPISEKTENYLEMALGW